MNAPAERLPPEVYSVATVRAIDRYAIEQLGVPGYELMNRAGAAALESLRRRWPAARDVVVVTGAGNNGGDGFVLARLARAAGLSVRVLAVVPSERLKGDAALAAADCAAANVAIEPFAAAGVARSDVIVDALLGTGLQRPVDGEFRTAIEALNAAARPVLALDVPSGLDADTGWRHGVAVRASATITFVALKQGLFLGEAADFTGELELATLGLAAADIAADAPRLLRLTEPLLDRALPRRPRSMHKGANGRLLLVGGGRGMPGAIRLAAEAALRVGAGLVYVATHAEHVAAVLSGRPEIICHGVENASDLDPLLQSVDAVVLGPGLGRSEWAHALWKCVLETRLPLVVDADALNLLAAEPRERNGWVLTPHPGEAARLLGLEGAGAVQRDRIAAAQALCRRFGATVVLKGAHSLIAAPDLDSVRVCDRGNPGMATAGMGDVLAGVIGGLFAQTRNLTLSVEAGVLLHALAGDAAAADGERGMVAADLFPHLRRCANRS